MEGEFFVFEGINGSGKTTVLQAVAERFKNERGEQNVVTMVNPTHGPVGTELRAFIAEQRERGFPLFFLDGPETKAFAYRLALLFLADRVAMQRELREHIAAGKTVLCDRYSLSTLVYQSAMVGDVGMTGPLATMIADFHEHAALLTPDTTVIIDVPVDVARGRLVARGERIDDTMMQAIEPAARAMYLKYGSANHDGDVGYRTSVANHVENIDGNQPIGDVVDATWLALEEIAF